MKKLLVFFSIMILLLVTNIAFAENQPARDLIASIGQMGADPKDNALSEEIVKAIDDVYPGKIIIKVFPYMRSINTLIEGQADFQLPNMINPVADASKLDYQYVPEKLGVIYRVVYSNEDKIITKKMIDDALAKGGQFPYNIEALNAPTSNTTEQLFKKVQEKRLDAFLWQQDDADRILKELKLNKIHRELFSGDDDVMIVQKGAKGNETSKLLSDCIKKLKASGKLQAIYNKVRSPIYNDWQPSKMGW